LINPQDHLTNFHRSSFTYPRTGSLATSDEVAWERFYICRVTMSDTSGHDTAIFREKLPSAEIGVTYRRIDG
jgi:hypothetical protein